MICNVAAYKFITLDFQFLTELKEELCFKTKNLLIKGTILLSPEGINLFLAGDKRSIESFQNVLHCFSDFVDLPYKYSYCEKMPFKKLLIKIKNDLIACDDTSIKPSQHSAPYVSTQTLKNWFEEKQDMLILDTRNKFEFDRGHFNEASHLNINNFRQFENAVTSLPEDYKDKTIVTYCTGGIRCEKAALILMKHGFKNVYQLEGGILNYFEQCGSEYYQGDCFVFDERIALTSDLKPA